MGAHKVNLVVVDGGTSGKPIELSVTEKGGHPVKVKAAKGLKFLLVDDESGHSPQNVTMVRVGDDLQVSLEGTATAQPELIIESYYAVEGSKLVGQAESGAYYDYIASDGDTAHFTAAQRADQDTPLVLGGMPLAIDTPPPAPMESKGLSPWAWSGLALIGVGGIALAAGHGGGGSNHDSPVVTPPDTTPPEKPLIASLIDDVGSRTNIVSGGVTDDSTPTLSGTAAAGDTINVFDGSTKLGSVVVPADGSWSFTPSSELAEGQHSLTVVAVDPAGNTSVASDPYEVIIDANALVASRFFAPTETNVLTLSQDPGSDVLASGAPIHGQAGLDVLQLLGDHQVLDLRGMTGTDAQSKVASIETFDLGAAGSNTLKLSVDDVLHLGQVDLFREDGNTQVMVTGGAGDQVDLYTGEQSGLAPGAWANTGPAEIDGVTYAVYEHSALNAELLVQQGIQVALS